MTALHISERNSGGVTILDLEGKVLLGEESTALREAIRGLLQAGKKSILLNLSGVTAIDSSGLGTLVSCYATARKEGARLGLYGLSEKVNDIMSVTKLATVFDLYEDEKAATAGTATM
jgi:anti-sigma B factor antagonist